MASITSLRWRIDKTVAWVVVISSYAPARPNLCDSLTSPTHLLDIFRGNRWGGLGKSSHDILLGKIAIFILTYSFSLWVARGITIQESSHKKKDKMLLKIKWFSLSDRREHSLGFGHFRNPIISKCTPRYLNIISLPYIRHFAWTISLSSRFHSFQSLHTKILDCVRGSFTRLDRVL